MNKDIPSAAGVLFICFCYKHCFYTGLRSRPCSSWMYCALLSIQENIFITGYNVKIKKLWEPSPIGCIFTTALASVAQGTY